MQEWFRASKLEQERLIYCKADADGDGLVVSGDKRYAGTDILECTKRSLTTTTAAHLRQYITAIDNEEVNAVIELHTHLGILAMAKLSEVDKNTLMDSIESANRLSEAKGKEKLLVLMGVIANNGLNVFEYNDKKQSIERVDLFIGGIEQCDPHEEISLRETIKRSFAAGRRQAKTGVLTNDK